MLIATVFDPSATTVIATVFERSTKAARTWPDEHIEFWGEVYEAHPEIRERGVLFEMFIAYPVPVLIAMNIPCPVPKPAPSPQLSRLLAALDRCAGFNSNGRLVEKLRHRRNIRTRHRRRDDAGRLL